MIYFAETKVVNGRTSSGQARRQRGGMGGNAPPIFVFAPPDFFLAPHGIFLSWCF